MATKQSPANKRDDRKDSSRGAEHAGQMMREAAEAAHNRILDDPRLPEQPSGVRHTLYFTAIMVFAFVLQVVVITLIAR